MNRKYFVDAIDDDGHEHPGSILYPLADATAQKEDILKAHPDWIVELIPIEATL